MTEQEWCAKSQIGSYNLCAPAAKQIMVCWKIPDFGFGSLTLDPEQSGLSTGELWADDLAEACRCWFDTILWSSSIPQVKALSDWLVDDDHRDAMNDGLAKIRIAAEEKRHAALMARLSCRLLAKELR